MKKVFLAALAALAVCTSAAWATQPQTLADGQSLVVGGTDRDCAVSQCVRIERSGDLVFHYAIAKGQVKQVLTVEVPQDAVLMSTVKSVKTVGDTPGRLDLPDQAPPPPPGGTGSVIVSETYVTATEIIVVTQVFYFSNGQLVGVTTTQTSHSRKPQ